MLSALRTLSSFGEATRIAPRGADDTTYIADALFSPAPLAALCDILSQTRRADVVVREQKEVVGDMISWLCKTPAHQAALADSGVLDALATVLASFVVARGEVIPGALWSGQSDGLAELIPPPADGGADLSSVLEALSAIVANSRFRACLLLCSPALMAVFPHNELAPPVPPAGVSEAWLALVTSGLVDTDSRDRGPMDYLLPTVLLPQSKIQARSFRDYPPLGFSKSRDNLAAAASGRVPTYKFTGLDLGRPEGSAEDETAEEPESPLIPWLIHIIRSGTAMEKIGAASLLASLFKAGFTGPEREHMMGVLVIPILWDLLEYYPKEIPKAAQRSATISDDIAHDLYIQHRTLDVLARLVGESEVLQRVVFDCGVMQEVYTSLMSSYEPLESPHPPPTWSPVPGQGNKAGDRRAPASCRVGSPGQVPAYVHRMRIRESALKLAAAMATLSNDYREELVMDRVTPYIVESLSPRPGKPRGPKEQPVGEQKPEDGGDLKGPSVYGYNTKPVLIAACHAIRALARSPKIVRTTLQDHGVAKPILKLLLHSDMEVKIAASGAVINLLTNCSPMVTVSSFSSILTSIVIQM